MNNVKLFSALAIILAVAIAPMSGAFAQSDDAENSDRQIDKEQRKKLLEQIKEQRHALRDQLRDFSDQRKDRLTDRPIVDVKPSLEFKGETAGWAVLNGQAHSATFSIEGKAAQTERGWHLTGTGTVSIGDRDVVFDLKGFAKDGHVGIKGISQSNESVVIHLRGHFAPIVNSEDSFALAFTRAAITVQDSDVKIPLVLVGDVKVQPIIPVDDVDENTSIESDVEPFIENQEELDDILELLT